jgi:hypothetical protein
MGKVLRAKIYPSRLPFLRLRASTMMGRVAPLSTTRSLTGLSLSLLLGTIWWLSSWLLISRPVFFLAFLMVLNGTT